MKNRINNLIKSNYRSYSRSNGKITVRHKYGGHKKLYRIIDFHRNKFDIPGIINSFVYDPNRNVKLALINYKDGEKRYIIKTMDMNLNDNIISTKKKIIYKTGFSTEINNIVIGENINNVEIFPGSGSTYSRSLGSSCQLLYKDYNYALIKLMSGVKKKVSLKCIATIGKVCNEFKKKKYKAGQNFWIGIKPTVRGVAMNPVDHPHGGGEGKTSGGRHPCSPNGIKSKGYKTKKKNAKVN